jgi:hypothetical protein
MPAVFVCLMLLFFACLNTVQAAGAFEGSYLPLSQRALSHRIRQKLQADPLEAGQTLLVGGTRIRIENVRETIPAASNPTIPGTANSTIPGHADSSLTEPAVSTILQVLGADKDGKPWSYVSSAWTGCASVWTADLDKNGSEDLIIFMRTGQVLPAPASELLVLLFEKSGRPVPFAVDGYFEVDSRGIKDFVNLENDRHCQLIRQSLDNGYWITSLYEAGASSFRRLPKIGSMKLPLYTRFSWHENHQCSIPPVGRQPFESDLSNDRTDTSMHEKFLEALYWPEREKSGTPYLLLADGQRLRPAAGCRTMTVVLDEPGGRRMASLSAPEAVRKLLDEICYRRLPLTVCGNRQKAGRVRSGEFLFAAAKSGFRPAPVRHGTPCSLDSYLTAARLELP